MPIDVRIVDGFGTGKRVGVNGEGELNVVVHPHPPENELRVSQPFRQYFTDDGTSTGSNDMRVASDTDFCINAENGEDAKDIFIKSISFVIADASATLDKFGNITALTNGINIKWKTTSLGDVILAESLQTNWDFIRFSGGTPSFGDGATVFRANNVFGNSEGYIPFLDFEKLFGFPYGLKLGKNTNDKLVIEIRDNTTGVDEFDAITYGLKI